MVKWVLNFEHVESLFCIVTTRHRLDRFGWVWYRWDGHDWIFIIKIISDQWRPLFMVVLTGSFLLIFFNFAYNHLKCLCACLGNYYDIQIWVWNFDGAFVKQSTAKSNLYLETWSTQEPKLFAIHGCVTLLFFLNDWLCKKPLFLIFYDGSCGNFSAVIFIVIIWN